MGRAAPLLALLLPLVVYDAVAGELPALSTAWDIVVLGILVIPATFALVWFALPYRRALAQWPLAVGLLAFAGLTVAFEAGDLEIAANFSKFAAVALAGWWFLGFFEAVAWVLLVAFLIVPVDIYSVAQGPTRVIVDEQPQIFDVLSVAFPVPGEPTSAQLGLPDILFFALFLGAAERFGLRTGWTWVAMVLSFGATLAAAVYFDVGGLPALPLLSAAFVAVNADLLWRAWRRREE